VNKKILSLVIIIILVVGAYFLLKGNKSFLDGDNSGIDKARTGKTIVSMTDKNGFFPFSINIKQGETVVFENNGTEDHWPASAIHPTHQIFPEFDPKRPISPGDSWSFTFDKAGIWKFHDHLEPSFFGTINVE